jgi:hypothetical protein
MIASSTHDAGFDLSYFDLFVHGMTSNARKLYFGMDLCMSLAEYKLERSGSEFGVGIGGEGYDFLNRYVTFLVEQRLITMDWATYVVEIEDLQLQDTFLSALTPRGRALIRHISKMACGLVEERPVSIQPGFRDVLRFALGEEFKASLADSWTAA